MKCPECGATSVARSHRRGSFESVVLTALSIYPFRCRSCRARFFRRHARLEHEAENTIHHKPAWMMASLWALAMLAVAAAIVALVVAFAD